MQQTLERASAIKLVLPWMYLISTLYLAFFQEESLVGFCRSCSKKEQIMLLAVLKVFGNYAGIVLFSLNYAVLAFELCCFVFKRNKG